MRFLAPFLLVVSATAGCMDWASVQPCPNPEGWFLAGPRDEAGAVSAFHDNNGGYERLLYFARNPHDLDGALLLTFTHEGKTQGHGSKTGYSPVTDARGPDATILGGTTPSFAKEYETVPGEWSYDFRVNLIAPPACDLPGSFLESFTFREGTKGDEGYAGVGVMAKTAGFWHNGTLFYTNIASVHTDPRIAHAGWYAYEGDDPLPVYVYNSTRTELPRRYNESGFVTTIPGFNAALKGIYEGTSRVANLAPEDAYTRLGNEQHALYGDPIVFYIEIVDVVAIPCPLPAPACDVPAVPPPPT